MAKTKKREKQIKAEFVEITRSFSYKMNLGNYQTADHFCSQKTICSPQDAEKMSEILYNFVKNEVIKSVNAYKKEILELKPEERPIYIPRKTMKQQAEDSQAKQELGEELKEGKEKLDEFIKRSEGEGDLIQV